jgi:hypothetical protein
VVVVKRISTSRRRIVPNSNRRSCERTNTQHFLLCVVLKHAAYCSSRFLFHRARISLSLVHDRDIDSASIHSNTIEHNLINSPSHRCAADPSQSQLRDRTPESLAARNCLRIRASRPKLTHCVCLVGVYALCLFDPNRLTHCFDAHIRSGRFVPVHVCWPFDCELRPLETIRLRWPLVVTSVRFRFGQRSTSVCIRPLWCARVSSHSCGSVEL